MLSQPIRYSASSIGAQQLLQKILTNTDFALGVIPHTTRFRLNGREIQSEVLSVEALNP